MVSEARNNRQLQQALLQMAEQAKQKRAKREKEKLEKDGRFYGNNQGPKNFIKDHKLQVANRTADYVKYRAEQFNEYQQKQIQEAKQNRENQLEEKRTKDLAYMQKWIEYRFQKEIAIHIIKKAREQQERARLFYMYIFMHHTMSKLYSNFRTRNDKVTKYYKELFNIFRIKFRIKMNLMQNYGQRTDKLINRKGTLSQAKIKMQFRKETYERH